MAIVLGERVSDRMSGFFGVAVSRHHYLQGCDRVTVQPPVTGDNVLPDTKTFDEPDLETVGEGVSAAYPEEHDDKGGPRFAPEAKMDR